MSTDFRAAEDFRIARARTVAEASGKQLEVWEGNGGHPQLFTSEQHPGVALTMAELRDLPRDGSVYRYVIAARSAA